MGYQIRKSKIKELLGFPWWSGAKNPSSQCRGPWFSIFTYSFICSCIFSKIFFRYIPRRCIAGSYGSSLFFWEISILFSTEENSMQQFTYSPTVYKGFLLSIFLPTCFCVLFWRQSFWQVWGNNTSLWFSLGFLFSLTCSCLVLLAPLVKETGKPLNFGSDVYLKPILVTRKLGDRVVMMS